jgi:hypothetical protein
MVTNKAIDGEGAQHSLASELKEVVRLDMLGKGQGGNCMR